MELPPVEFSRVAIAPFECISEGWTRVRDQYWLFVGICGAGILLGSFVPLGILMGAMMCGIYYCLLERWRGRRVRFEQLFKGCDSSIFVQTLIPSLLMVALSFAITIPIVVLAFASGMVVAISAANHHAGDLPAAVVFILMGGGFVLVMLATVLLSVFMLFAYPLIIDRRMRGLDAMKLSARAAMAHVWGLLGLSLVLFGIGLLGALCCYVGAFLVMPISFGAFAAAYVKVFGLSEDAARLKVQDNRVR